jgi:hypothetical protein
MIESTEEKFDALNPTNLFFTALEVFRAIGFGVFLRMNHMNTPRPHFRVRAGLFFLGGAALLLSGCGHMRYQGDSNGFNEAYADSSNRQMLLNLARLDQHDPTYFLQFGQISVSYQFTSTLSGIATNTVPSGLRVPVVGETGNIGVGASTQPAFTFIPVNDQLVAQELLQPISAQVIYSLFEEGAPVDELLRLTVERMEIQLPGQTTSTVYTNSLVDDNSRFHDGVASYATFLKVCALARQLQLADCLELKMDSSFKEAAKGWTTGTPSAKDILDAKDKGLEYKQGPDGKWMLGSMQGTPRFVLKPGSEAVIAELKKNPCYATASLDNMTKILTQGFSVEGGAKDSSGGKGEGSRLVLRSFLLILAAAAQEQAGFQACFVPSKYYSLTPPEERQPLLKMRWGLKDGPTQTPLMALIYRGTSYEITDPATDQVTQQASWNRDVFRLIVQLASQVSVDISKFPLPTSLQVLPSP